VISFEQEAERLVNEAEAAFAEGSVANQISDDYILNTVSSPRYSSWLGSNPGLGRSLQGWVLTSWL
jgi:hypothetical protein